MMRSLFSGVSGLKSHQVRMDVIGNNISNVNTIGYKRNRADFNELFSQKLLGVGGSSGNTAYVGLGAGVGAINASFTQGAFQTTDRITDLALDGDGFFLGQANGRQLLTRAGNLGFDSDGFLVTGTGVNIQGWQYTNQNGGQSTLPSDVRIDWGSSAPPQVTANIRAGGNLNAATSVATGAPADLEMTMSTVIYNAQGTPETVIMKFTKIADATAVLNDEWRFELFKADGVTTIDDTAGPNPVVGTVQFDSAGALVALTGTSNATAVAGTAEFDFDFNYDLEGDGVDETIRMNFGGNGSAFPGITQYASGSGNTASDSTLAFKSQDGFASGKLQDYSIDSFGIVRLKYDNGFEEDLYQIALAQVNNPNGLERIGDSLYGFGATAASGSLTIGRAGNEIPATMVSGALEQSNVDLASEFTDMIITQRGFQANARVITTSDELLAEVVQLKR